MKKLLAGTVPTWQFRPFIQTVSELTPLFTLSLLQYSKENNIHNQ